MLNKRNYAVGTTFLLALILISAYTNCSGGMKALSEESLPSTSLSSLSEETNPPSITPTSITAQSVSTIPAGAVMPMATANCPAGWLPANGGLMLRATYTNLFEAIGISYGAGDGVSTFALPDYRGYFLRGVNSGASNDPDAASRTDRGDGVTGDNVGTKQGDELRSHKHFISAGIMYGSNPGGGDTTGGAQRVGQGSTDNVGGGETRPKNISVLYCISTGGQ